MHLYYLFVCIYIDVGNRLPCYDKTRYTKGKRQGEKNRYVYVIRSYNKSKGSSGAVIRSIKQIPYFFLCEPVINV